MTLPNFLIIGAAKSGTTSLHRYLDQHPRIYMSPMKEPNFFAFEGERPSFSGPGDEPINSRTVTDLEAYRKLFVGVTNEKVIGESSPVYLRSPKAPGRIRHYIPNAKLIVILRNPVDRTYSAYLHLVRDGRERLDFARALREEEARVRANWAWIWRYKRAGFYYEMLKRYYEAFDREQIRVYLYEDLRDDPIGLLQGLFAFLNVDETFAPDISSRHNVATAPRSRTLQRFIKHPSALKSALKPLFPQALRKRMAANLYKRNLAKNPPPMPEDVRRELTEAYREDIEKLQELIGRDLSGWLNKEA